MTYLFLAGALCLSQQSLTYEQIEEAKTKEFAAQTSLHETLTVHTPNEQGGENVMKRTLTVLGKSLHSIIRSGDELALELGRDGRESWIVMYGPKLYSLATMKETKEKEAPHQHQEPLSEGESVLDFGTERPVAVRTNPSPKVSSIETVTLDGKPYRLVIAKAITKDKSREWVIKQWFLQDKWLLKRLEVTEPSKNPKPRVRAEVELDFTPKVDASLFKLDPRKVEGFTKMDIPSWP